MRGGVVAAATPPFGVLGRSLARRVAVFGLLNADSTASAKKSK